MMNLEDILYKLILLIVNNILLNMLSSHLLMGKNNLLDIKSNIFLILLSIIQLMSLSKLQDLMFYQYMNNQLGKLRMLIT